MPLGRRTAIEAVKLGFEHLGTPYVWGGPSWGGCDCSHFVWLCYGYANYFTTESMVTTNGLAAYGFEKRAFSPGTVQFGDIVVFNGHTGICAPSNVTSGSIGVLQSTPPRVTWIGGAYGGGHWTHIWHPKEGWGFYPIKWEGD